MNRVTRYATFASFINQNWKWVSFRLRAKMKNEDDEENDTIQKSILSREDGTFINSIELF